MWDPAPDSLRWRRHWLVKQNPFVCRPEVPWLFKFVQLLATFASQCCIGLRDVVWSVVCVQSRWTVAGDWHATRWNDIRHWSTAAGNFTISALVYVSVFIFFLIFVFWFVWQTKLALPPPFEHTLISQNHNHHRQHHHRIAVLLCFLSSYSFLFFGRAVD